ncbi:glycosyltransferase family 2 protein [Sandaracinobacteroides hominis]|uniref:glycosyltransferase family 2 protein n=1 Tax=Sandaracinobacteroides hominis TaxID=2780086 RepID=UPI0018F32E45|nr:glycosyltransferase family 2 protein [Sandaracinobacteroides hominis]
MQTSFSTVVVTRNRPDVLALALPLHIAQSRLPEKLLIVDSSDNPEPNRQLAERLALAAPFPIQHQVSSPGISVQRNIGVSQVSSDVIFMPDDDSLLHADAVAQMLHIYDLDTEQRIGGVCSLESRTPPPGTLGSADIDPARPVYHKRRADRLKSRVTPHVNRFENRHFPDPMKHAARRLQQPLAIPAWLAQEQAVPVEWMPGFRMSFRTQCLKAVGFNELLGRYSLFEDVDAGLGVLGNGRLLVGTHRAHIYHHRSPENRSNGRTMGAIQILNRAYITCRHSPADSERDRTIRNYSRFRLFQFRMLSGRNSYERQRYEGASAAVERLPRLLAAGPALDETYLGLRREILALE